MELKKPPPRVLLLYPEFQHSYWNMKFVCKQHGSKTLTPPLGLLTVAALLPREWQLRLVDENAQIVTEDDWNWAEVVLLSAMIVQKDRLHALIRQAKERGKTVAVGGPYPTIVSEEILAEGADVVVKGEIENLVHPFLEAIQTGKTGLVLESSKKPDLVTSPIPRFDLLHLPNYVALCIQTTRGCPFDCEFCDVVSLFGRKVRHKTTEQVLAELEAVYRLGWRQEMFVSDDNFVGDQSYARDLLNQMIPWMKSHAEPYEFWTQASVNLGHAPELIDLMTESNFSNVFIGIESPDEDVLKFTRKYHNVKHALVDSINTITRNGLTVIGSFILGFDNEGPGAGERIAAFVEATNIPQVMLNLLMPLPHTRLWKRLQQEGRLLEDDLQGDWRNLSFNGSVKFRTVRPEAEILTEYLQLWELLFDRSNYLSRAYNYYLSMRPTRAVLARDRGEASSSSSQGKPFSFMASLRNLLRFLRLSWRQGVLPSCRLQYWTQLFDLFRRNPSRVFRYLNACVIGEDMVLLREMVGRNLEHLKAGDHKSSSASYAKGGVPLAEKNPQGVPDKGRTPG